MPRSILICAALVFTGLNLGWELLQLPLYTIWWTEPWSRIVFALLPCTAGDLMIGSLALCAALLLVGQGWPREPHTRVRVIVLTTLLGVGYTVASEWLNVVVRQTWAYTQAMPRLPLFGTGLSPVLQWLLLPGLALHLAAGVGSEQGHKTARNT
jgi:hypothetical protein